MRIVYRVAATAARMIGKLKEMFVDRSPIPVFPVFQAQLLFPYLVATMRVESPELVVAASTKNR